ncbi:MAG: hypothetical protein NVS1B9_01390 [Solirubrobacteraceae bacterium]
MRWSEVFIVLLASHLAGDFLLQTEFQAVNKYGALGGGGDPRALLAHALTYTLVFVPALVWIAGEDGLWTLVVALLISVPHLLQDDGRLVKQFAATVKHTQVEPGQGLFIAIDQSFHVLVLLVVAWLAAS